MHCLRRRVLLPVVVASSSSSSSATRFKSTAPQEEGTADSAAATASSHASPQLSRQRQPSAAAHRRPFADDHHEGHHHEDGLRSHSAATTTTTTATTAGDALQQQQQQEEAAVNAIDQFFAEKELAISEKTRRENEENVLMPPTPDEAVPPEFERVRRSQKMFIRFNDPDIIVHEQKWHYVPLPPPKAHPWADYTKMGRFIVHGDGMLNVVGTGEVGFDKNFANGKPFEDLFPADYRGMRRFTPVGKPPPLRNGAVLQDSVVNYSLMLTGRGLFATRDVKKGELVMIVNSTAQNVGFNDEQTRLVDMTAQVLRDAHRPFATQRIEQQTTTTTTPIASSGTSSTTSLPTEAGRQAQPDQQQQEQQYQQQLQQREDQESEKSFLHQWVLTGQLSSIVERWKPVATDLVLKRIGGMKVLRDLELHKEHIGRIASAIHRGWFLVESSHAERRGCAYWPEAALLNHSCDPNLTYEIIPEHMFTQSEFYLSATDEELAEFELENLKRAAAAAGAGAVSGGSGGGGGNPANNDAGSQGEPAGHSTANANNNAIHHRQKGDVLTPSTSSSNNNNNSGNSNSHNKHLPSPPAPPPPLSTTTSTTTDTDSSSASPAHVSSSPSSSYNNDIDAYNNTDAPTYLFCARATKDIKKGEEMLISYIPTEWPFYHRQEVLLDRYKFRCKCPRCSPDVDAKLNFSTRILLPMFFFLIFLKSILHMSAAKESEMNDDDRVDLFKKQSEGVYSGMNEPIHALHNNDPYSKSKAY